jgi:flagellar biogenesis protein FliO
VNTSPQIGQFQSLVYRLGEGPAICRAETEKKQQASFGSLPDGIALLVRKISSGVAWILRNVKVQQTRKTLRVCESVSMGERRFVAVIQVDNQRFLIGGGTGSVSLLSRLPESSKAPSTNEHSAETETKL